MSNYVIFTDSSADFSKQMIKEIGVNTIPLTYLMGGTEFSDTPVDTGEQIKTFYSAIKGGARAMTSQITADRFVKAFSEQLDAGRDVLYLGFSSALSGTYSQGAAAAEQLREQYPDRKIITVDTLAASLGEGLLVYNAAMMKNSGKTIEQVADYVTENRLHLCHWFTVDDLNHLKRGGRVSPTVALLGTVLGIKPILHVDNEGRLISVSKVRGRQNSLDELVNRAEQSIINPTEQVIFISHGDSIEDAKYVGEQMKRRLGVKDVRINYVGPVIGSHSGPGTIALFFFGTQR